MKPRPGIAIVGGEAQRQRALEERIARPPEFALIGEPVMALVNALPWPAVAVDEIGFVVLVNAAMRAHRPHDAERAPRTLAERFPEYHAALRGNPRWLTPQEAGVERETQAGCVHERVVVRPIPGGACLIVEDLTRLRALETADAQTARLAALGFMLAGASHELSNPLAAIYSMVQLLRGNPRADPEIEKGLAHIGHNVQRLLEISQRLCGFARVGDEPRTVFPVDESVEESIVLLRQSGQLDDVALVRQSDPDALVIGDAGRLREVFHNIVLNAIQAMEGHGRLLVRTSRRVQEVEVAVHDSGPGVPERSITRLFEPFFTTKRSGRGTGLGLTISQEIVHQHGGRIRVENDPVRGAWFFVVLPLAAQP